jgi:uncharacterized protein YndB with AHSA1/START domain
VPESAVAVPAETRRMFRVTIEGTIAEVWREISRTDAPIPAFFNMRMDVPSFRPGAPLRMRSGNGKYTGVVGEVLEWDPPRRFAHSFRFTNFDDPPCKVIYELAGRDGAVEFTLIIEELPLGTKTAKQMVQGSELIVQTLKATVEGRRIPGMMKFIHVMSSLTAPLTPAKCLSSRWP